MYHIKKLILFFFFSISALVSAAQLTGSINIDQLTDQQLMQYAQANNLNGLSESDLEAKAKEKGLSNEQIQKLKSRLQFMNLSNGQQNQEGKQQIDNKRQGVNYLLPKPSADSINGLLIFGSNIFTKENLTFEPNLNIPTPKNYNIGAGDELKIDIYGFSEKSQTLKVSPDGFIKYPNIGPIKIAGLTFDEVKVKLNATLIKIYPGLKTGNTNLQLSLGQIRSIRVNLIGEISKPGSYSVPSLSTIANALYAAGGPTKIGSYRNIELIRSGKSIAKFDLYEYLLKGDLTQNKVLQDDDVIRVAPYTNRVEFRGAIKRPAIYEVGANDRLENIINYAGGLGDNANKEFIRIARFGKLDNEIVTVSANDVKGMILQTGDKIYVDSVASIFKNRVSITGAVYYQGVYSLEKMVTLKDILVMSKPKEVAYKERALLRRFKEDYSIEIIGFNINEVLEGKFNVNLFREDSIHIYPINELKEVYKIKIRGEVNKPDSFYYAKGMLVRDAILMAGGFKDGATRKSIEVARRIRDTASSTIESTKYAVIISADLSSANSDESLNIPLEPFDIISIRKSPGYKEQISVTIEGEVMYPGNYAIISNQDKISDLLKRAGGLKQGGYPKGAFLLRKTFENLSVNDTIILKNKLETLKSTFSDTSKSKAADSTFKDDLKIVGLRLDEIMEKPGSFYDVLLQEGDILKIPKKVETVQTFTGVYFPKKTVYRDGLTIRQVIRESGGVLPGGQKKRAYVVYPNGEVRTTKNFLFIRNYPAIKPGSEVYIPVKKLGSGISTVEIIAITTGIATLATLILSIQNMTK